MIELRFHGRGGQGAVVASVIIATAAQKEGKYVQAFPTFGVERRGAPVNAYVRIDTEKILLRTFVYYPDHVVVLDPSLINYFDVTQGLKENGFVIVNTHKKSSDFNFPNKYRLVTIDATNIALTNKLGTKAIPIVNTAIVGAVSGLIKIVSLDSVKQAIKDVVSVKVEENIKAAETAFNLILSTNPQPDIEKVNL